MSVRAHKSQKLSLEERFWLKVDKSGGPKACWPWKAYCRHDGYGKFGLASGKMIGAHIEAFVLTHGFKPPMVCHSCDNPSCCNPKHLFARDHAVNVADMVAKARHSKGQQHAHAKLTEEKVLLIRKRFVPNDSYNGARALAREFKVGRTVVDRTVKGVAWKHLFEEGW